jgi:hypothetical protein
MKDFLVRGVLTSEHGNKTWFFNFPFVYLKYFDEKLIVGKKDISFCDAIYIHCVIMINEIL